MILFQINVDRVLSVPPECDAPRTIDVDCVTLRLSPERMEIEARESHLFRAFRNGQDVEPPQTSRLQIGCDLTALASLE
jgi:hypothetical protein